VVTISFFPGSYLDGDDQLAYSVAKAADDRMVAVMAADPEVARAAPAAHIRPLDGRRRSDRLSCSETMSRRSNTHM
jgi:hypothetical protein